jgi:hypothetical protein
MTQAIAGVTPSTVKEVTVMTVWPSIAVYPDGKMLGRLYSIKVGVWVITVGNLLALASIPHALFRYFFRLATGKCYKLTNRRVIELGNRLQYVGGFPAPLHLHLGRELRWVDLDRFDAIEIVQQSGQEWFDAGDLIFKNGNVETFRLDGVYRPESFRQTCLKSRAAYVGVKQAMAKQAVLA